MDSQKSNKFDYQIGYAYPLNYRIEHKQIFATLENKGVLYKQLQEANSARPIHAGFFVWGGRSEELVTFLTQRAIIGVESYLVIMLIDKAAQLNKLTKIFLKILDNPLNKENNDWIIQKLQTKYDVVPKMTRSTPHLLYKHLPVLLEKEMGMNKDLFFEVESFYNTVRNPLFHGKIVTSSSPEPLLACYKLINQIYDWIDSWHPPKIKSDGIAFKWK